MKVAILCTEYTSVYYLINISEYYVSIDSTFRILSRFSRHDFFLFFYQVPGYMYPGTDRTRSSKLRRTLVHVRAAEYVRNRTKFSRFT